MSGSFGDTGGGAAPTVTNILGGHRGHVSSELCARYGQAASVGLGQGLH